MKKILINICLVLLLLVTPILFLSGCGDNNGGNSQEGTGGNSQEGAGENTETPEIPEIPEIPETPENGTNQLSLSATMFNGYRAKIGKSNSLGIINKKIKTDSFDKKNFFVGFDNENNVIEIQFEKIVPTYNEEGEQEDIVVQANIKAQIDKLYITKDYIFFTLTISASTNRGQSEVYDQSFYYCNSQTQSFLIDRLNYNIYSLSTLPSITYINENIIQSNNNYYLLTIENNQIVFTDLVPNKAISIKDVVVDKNGFIYVFNNAVNEIKDNIIYIVPEKYNSYTYHYTLASDGYVYKIYTQGFTSFLVQNCQISRYNTLDNKWISPILTEPVEFSSYVGNTSLPALLIKNNYIYYGNGNNCFYNYYTRYANCLSTSDYVRFENSISIVDFQAFSYLNGNLYMHDTSNGSTIKNKTLVMSDIFKVEFFDKYIMVTKELLEGTKKYQVTIDSNYQPVVDLVSEVTYEQNIIIIKPLTFN